MKKGNTDMVESGSRDMVEGVRPLSSPALPRGVSARSAMTILKKEIGKERGLGATWRDLSLRLAALGVKVSPKRMSAIWSDLSMDKRPLRSETTDASDYGVNKEAVWDALDPLIRAAINRGATKADLIRVFSRAGVECSRRSFKVGRERI